METIGQGWERYSWKRNRTPELWQYGPDWLANVPVDYYYIYSKSTTFYADGPNPYISFNAYGSAQGYVDIAAYTNSNVSYLEFDVTGPGPHYNHARIRQDVGASRSDWTIKTWVEPLDRLTNHTGLLPVTNSGAGVAPLGQFQVLTRAQYDALATKNPQTMYFVIED